MVKGTLTEVRDLGMQVDRRDSTQLIDHCILKFKTEDGEEFETYSLSKGCHASSRLGKIIRILLGRDVTKDDYVDNHLQSDILLGKEAYLDIGENRIIKGVFGADNEG